MRSVAIINIVCFYHAVIPFSILPFSARWIRAVLLIASDGGGIINPVGKAEKHKTKQFENFFSRYESSDCERNRRGTDPVRVYERRGGQRGDNYHLARSCNPSAVYHSSGEKPGRPPVFAAAVNCIISSPITPANSNRKVFAHLSSSPANSSALPSVLDLDPL